MSDIKFYLIVLTVAVFTTNLPASAHFQQQPSTDNVYQREHSLVKPYQGSGMVSTLVDLIQEFPFAASIKF